MASDIQSRTSEVTREEGRRDRFYLTNHDRFYLWLYGIGHIAKSHTDSERGNSATTSLATFPVSSKGSFYMHHSTEDSMYHNLCYPVANQWLEWEISSVCPCHWLTTPREGAFGCVPFQHSIWSTVMTMGVIWWGTEGTCPPPPPTHAHTQRGQNIWCPPPLLGIKTNHIFQYLFAFYSHFYWTYPDHMFSLSTYIQIFWACTVYRGWEETEIRAIITFIFSTTKIRKNPIPLAWLCTYTALTVSHIKHFYIPIDPLPLPPPPPQTHFFLANDAHGDDP